ncbi:MAG TPA: hypothetical protein VEJ18_17335 [Planctomycetota bacterium]|nr:hypothetical protein [Planctomycetota bacterium]
MSKLVMSLAFLVAAPLAAVAQASKDDIKKLAAAGVSDEVILAYVRSNGAPRLSADELIELKNAGVTEKVLAALASPAAPAPAPSTPAPATRTEVVERVVEQPVYRTQYVYTPSVSSYWCSAHYCYDSCRPYYYYPTYTYVRPYPYYSSYYCGPSYRYYSYPRVSVGFGFSWGGRRCR